MHGEVEPAMPGTRLEAAGGAGLRSLGKPVAFFTDRITPVRRERAKALVLNIVNDTTDLQTVLARELGLEADLEHRWRRAADAGNTEAMNNLGILLRSQVDLPEAEICFQRAADAGDTGAMTASGPCSSAGATRATWPRPRSGGDAPPTPGMSGRCPPSWLSAVNSRFRAQRV